jgi:uncharacterized protein (TIGR03437 family)
VTITGSHFSGATGVTFGSLAASFTVNSDGSITATAPAQGAGTVDIFVTTSGGTSSATTADRFTYVAAPVVTGVSPSSGSTAGGTVVTITGSHFSGATAVSFGGQAASFTVNGDGSITATAPAGAAGTVDIVVTAPGGTSAAVAADRFTYTAQGTPPTVTGLSKHRGPTTGGTKVTITGTNFAGATKVFFGNVAALNFQVISATQIVATAPAHAAGTVDVLVTTPAGTSTAVTADRYTYQPAPTLASLQPSQGSHLGGNTLTITGTNFVAGDTTVLFGTKRVTAKVLSSTKLTVTVPSHAVGTVDVFVTTSGGASAGDPFTYV